MAELKRNSDWHYANQGSLVSKLDGKLIAIIDTPEEKKSMYFFYTPRMNFGTART